MEKAIKKTKSVVKKSKEILPPEDMSSVVQMVTPGNGKVTRNYHQEISKIRSLGKEIKISPKSFVTVNKPGFKTEFFVETVNVLIGIGKNHTADLIMSIDSWEALNAGAKVHITTLKEFIKKY
jgi:DNA-binding winged helix-turn-helix (wHTH) protein